MGQSEIYAGPMAMTKTQVYLPADELRELHRIARRRNRPVAELIRQAIRAAWLQPQLTGPVALCDGLLRGTSAEHDAAFDES
jgi:hypothetical protein